jgi:hypothetical protein
VNGPFSFLSPEKRKWGIQKKGQPLQMALLPPRREARPHCWAAIRLGTEMNHGQKWIFVL